MLLVLAVQEAGLRSTLAAQLAMAGASLITAKDVDDPAATRGMRRPAVLVLDAETVSGKSETWLAETLEDPRWHQVVTLTPSPPAPHPKLMHCPPVNAVSVLTEKLPQWRDDSGVA